jgi:hypothetical protein
MAHEVEPGVIAIADNVIRGVHVTRLLSDGSDRERGEGAKITIGTGFIAPIVLAPPNDLMGHSIAEGIEKALAVHAATGLGAWASGGASRLPSLADLVPTSCVECVTIIVDDNDVGRQRSAELARRLTTLGFEVLMREAST